MLLLILFFLIFFVIPKLWLSYSINRYDKDLPGMPFNAKEFGNILLKENDLTEIAIEETNLVDHYDLKNKMVRVQEGRLEKKSITALSIICHEIGHAIQHKQQYVLRLVVSNNRHLVFYPKQNLYDLKLL